MSIERSDSATPTNAEPARPEPWLRPGPSANQGLAGRRPGLNWDGQDDSTALDVNSPQDGISSAGARRRVFLTYLAARAALGLALVLAHVMLGVLQGRAWGGVLLLSAAYAVQAALWWLWPDRMSAADEGHLTPRRWWLTVGVDAAVFGTLHALDHSGALNYAALLVLPLLITGALSERRTALAMAAASALWLLGVAMFRASEPGASTSLVPQAGLAGMGLFLIALVSGQMAAWLARDERLARGTMELAHQQAELNRLVIEEMSDGVLVVDPRGQVQAANPAARALLADNDSCPQAPFSLGLHPGWLPLLAAVEAAYAAGEWPAAGLDITVSAGEDPPRALRVRARFTRGARIPMGNASVAGQPGSDDALAVLFVEALRDVQARQRQERLVAMGRISAGIAHEIRNPLAAISQANALLQEDALLPEQQWLVRITADNVERLKRLVDDVMEAAPGGGNQTPSIRLNASEQVRAICLEWARTAGLAQDNPSRMELVLPLQSSWVWFDPEHLRRVLVNLLDNALRYSTATEGSIFVCLELMDDGFAHLSVGSDGAPMAPETERHLFEPFHSTRSRGTGLGLYICRELCERHGAVIDYLRQPGERHENVFLVVMRRDMSDASLQDTLAT